MCKDIQIPHEFRVEIDDVCTKCFFKQTLSHSSSVLKLMLVDGPAWHSNFGDGALNQYKGVSSRGKSVSSRYKSVFTRTPVLDSFGCSFNVLVTVEWYERCNSRVHTIQTGCQSACFQLISCGITVTCSRFVGFLSSSLFLIIWSKNVFGRQQRFFPATTKINAVSRKNQKRSTRKA